MKKRSRSKPPPRAVSRRLFVKAGLGTLGAVVVGGSAGHYAAGRFNTIAEIEPARLAAMRNGATTLLFDRYPRLADSIPWRRIAIPGSTPVEALPHVAGAGDVQLFVKRDDGTSPIYGGNKVRKLEHILAAAELAGHRTLITLGGIGTHHGLATALHGARFGFATRLALFDQPVTSFVRQNVLGMAAAGAELQFASTSIGAAIAARRMFASAEAAGEAPAFIMVGGSSRLGSMGYVNAALELAAQVQAGLLPKPDRIFVALGSCGTAAGLAVGCRIAGLHTRITAVRVTTAFVGNRAAVTYMANDLAGWLHERDPSVPRVRLWPGDIDVVSDQFGRGYGYPTDAAAAAAAWGAPLLTVEPTYTAKALAACLDHCRGRARPGEVVLYWHTLNTAAFPADARLDDLPDRLRQRLDGAGTGVSA
jgi:D-cysteine desulfhydrase